MNIAGLDLGSFPLLLAPLEDITDSAFRNICREFGADMVYTEFVSSEGLIRDAVKSNFKLLFDEAERPLGIQLFGADPAGMAEAARIATEAKPEIIDINFGCPVRKVAMKGAGAALLADVPRMIEITKAVVKATNLPVTAKTRLGWDEKSKNIVEVAEKLQDCGIRALTIHGRTRAQLYGGTADWTLIGEVKNNQRMKIPIIGNGDITSPQAAVEMKNRFGTDAVMIGRAAIGNPWIFSETRHYIHTGELPSPPELKERISVCLRHMDMAIAKKGELKAIMEMRRHYAGYFKTVPHFKQVRLKLLTVKSRNEIAEILYQVLQDQY